MGKLRTLSGLGILVVVLSVTQVDSFPRKKLDHSRSSRLASVLSDFWTERGFHDALTDHLLASESQTKDLMMTGDDDVVEYRGKSAIRVPRGRLTPPGVEVKPYSSVVSKLAQARRNRQKRKRLLSINQNLHRYPRVRVLNHLHHHQSPPHASRKQDMEIMESVTLIDGGTPQDDGTIQIRPARHQSERKYQQGNVYDEDQLSPLNYHLADDDLTLAYKQQQQLYHQGQSQPRQPVVTTSFHTLPYGASYPSSEPQGKLSLGQLKQPKSIPMVQPSMSLNQFQQQLFQQQGQRPQHASVVYSTPKPQVVPIFVIPPPPKQKQAPLTRPFPSPQLLPSPPPQYTIPTTTAASLPAAPTAAQQAKPGFNAQLFQQQFNHPFATQPPSQLSSLAQLTATLLQGASSVAAATSAAANALAKGEFPTPPLPQLPQPSPSQSEISSPFPSYTSMLPSPTAEQQFGQGPLSAGLLSAASIPSASQVLLPRPTSSDDPTTPARPGVIADSDPLLQNQLVDQLGKESLAAKITQLVETGRKILYFPKGVMDTVDVVLKQMERNPMVAYWGDKFFAKVFGDTSGT